MKSAGEAVEILEAFDLTGSLRAASELAGCSPNTVARYVRRRAIGRASTEPVRRTQLVDPYLAKIEEWVERSHSRVRADVVHDKLRALGFGASERTTRRAVARAKKAYAAGHRRVFRPWIPEPGMWFQFDWGKGPRISGRETLLWCAWLAWSRFRFVIPTWDRTMPTVIACLDETLRRFGGSPTYALTDNERTVTIDRVAGIAVKHPVLVAAGRHYGLQVHACVPADPASKGGSESTVKIAKADLVPTDANLLPAYESFPELPDAAARWVGHTPAGHRRLGGGRAVSVGGPPIDALAVRERLRTAASSAELAQARLRIPEAPGSESPPLPQDLIRLLFRMRLPYMRAAAPTVCQVARTEAWDPARVLTVLLAEEVHGRERSSKEHRRAAAGFPTGKTFHAWREADSPIPVETQRALRTLDWVGRAENLVLVGPSGTGKSHLAEAVGHAAIDAGLRVTWFSLESLTAVITRSKVDMTTHKVVTRICRSELIVVDDIGQLPAGEDEAEALYRLVDAAYERRSLVLTSNLHPAAFDTILPKGLATATVDRLLHHAHVIVTEGRSQRLEDALSGRGVRPLPAPVVVPTDGRRVRP